MPNSETKILRDELAKSITETKKVVQQDEESNSKMNEMKIIIADLRTRPGYYDNPHPHTRYFLQRTRDKIGPQIKHLAPIGKKPRQKPGHPSTTRKNNAGRTAVLDAYAT